MDVKDDESGESLRGSQGVPPAAVGTTESSMGNISGLDMLIGNINNYDVIKVDHLFKLKKLL